MTTAGWRRPWTPSDDAPPVTDSAGRVHHECEECDGTGIDDQGDVCPECDGLGEWFE